MSHSDYLAMCDEGQTQRLMEMCKEKLDAINEEGWVKLWVVSDRDTNMRWFEDTHSSYADAVEYIAGLLYNENDIDARTEIHLDKKKYRPSEVADLLKVR